MWSFSQIRAQPLVSTLVHTETRGLTNINTEQEKSLFLALN